MKPACGTLYIVATPIGNLEDITLRALRVLRESTIVAAEDTRHTQKLLAAHGIHAQLTSYHDHNKETKAEVLITRMKAGENVALVSDAGTPLISDPGYHLVNRAHAEGVGVVAVPGPSAVTAALSIAGLPTDAYAFLGFLSNRGAKRRAQLAALAEFPHTLVFYESPHRLVACLEDIRTVLGEREAAVCRELTKHHEEVRRGPVSDLIAHFSGKKVLGEITLLVTGLTRREQQQQRREARRAERDTDAHDQ